MKVLLDIKDHKVSFFMEVLRNFPFVKATPLTDTKAQFLQELREAVEEVNQIKAKKKKGRPAKELLDEL